MIRKVMCSNPWDIRKAHKHIIQVHLCILQWFMETNRDYLDELQPCQTKRAARYIVPQYSSYFKFSKTKVSKECKA